MKIEIEISEDNEGCSAPWWMIINPTGGFSSFDSIANAITGPFFSREAAQKHLDERRYHFGKNAKVYCHSGYWSGQYQEAIKKFRKEQGLEPW